MRIETDQRSIEAEPAPREMAEAVRLFAESRRVDVALARVLAVIEGKRSFLLERCATIGEWAREKGFDALRATDLATLGKAMARTAELAPKVASGEVTTPAATAVAPILAKPGLAKPGEDWVAKAADTPLRELRREVKQRVEEARQQAPRLVPLTVFLSDENRERFRRARDLASQQARKELSESQAFSRITEHFLESFDPERAKARPRRVGPTEERPADRYVPREVVREVSKRSGLRCEVPGCGRIATEKAHVDSHQLGSGREKRHLWDACNAHHVMYDAGLLRIGGWTEDGRPIFVRSDGTPKRARPEAPRGPPEATGPPC